jgi:hypothetical protein
MRIRTVVGALVGGFMVFAFAAPAAAQVKVDFAGGYQYFHFLESGGVSVPGGWAASMGVGKERVKFVADVGANYEDHGSHFAKLHTFQGGVEFSGKDGRVVPFGRVLTGVGVFSDLGTDLAWVFTPEAGVKIMANDRVGVQTSVGFPIFVNGDGHAEGLRFFAGVVIRK